MRGEVKAASCRCAEDLHRVGKAAGEILGQFGALLA